MIDLGSGFEADSVATFDDEIDALTRRVAVVARDTLLWMRDHGASSRALEIMVATFEERFHVELRRTLFDD